MADENISVEIIISENATKAIPKVNQHFTEMNRNIRGFGLALNQAIPGMSMFTSALTYGVGAAAVLATTQLANMWMRTGLEGEKLMGQSGPFTKLQGVLNELSKEVTIRITVVTSGIAQELLTFLTEPEKLSGPPGMMEGYRELIRKQDNLQAPVRDTNDYAAAFRALSSATDAYETSAMTAEEGTMAIINALSRVPGAASAAASGIGTVSQVLAEYGAQVRGSLAGMVWSGDISSLTANAWQDQYIEQRAGLEYLKDTNLRAYYDEIANLNAYWSQRISVTKQGAALSLAETTKMQSEMRSAIQQSMARTWEGDPTNVLDRLGFHMDTVDEGARRMASVMNEGLHSQWTQEFARQGLFKPEDLISDQTVVAASARLLRGFELGDPRLLDRDIAKARVREILDAQQASQAWAKSLAAEMGVSSATVSAALGDYRSKGELANAEWEQGWQMAASQWNPLALGPSVFSIAATSIIKNSQPVLDAMEDLSKRMNEAVKKHLMEGVAENMAKKILEIQLDALENGP